MNETAGKRYRVTIERGDGTMLKTSIYDPLLQPWPGFYPREVDGRPALQTHQELIIGDSFVIRIDQE